VTGDYSDPDIERAIKQDEGYSMPGFPSVDVFNYLLQPELNRIKDPAQDCLQDVYLYLENLAEEIANRVFSRFPGLVGELLEVVSKVLTGERDSTKQILEDIIEAEQGYLFTNDYLMNRTDIIASKAPEDRRQQEGRETATSMFIKELRTRIDCYFKIVVRNIRDRVPKTIGFFLVQECQDKIQFHLYNEINQNQSLADVLGEHPAITEERNSLKKKLNILKHSSKVLMRDPEITSVLNLEEVAPKKEEEKKFAPPGRSPVNHGQQQRPQ